MIEEHVDGSLTRSYVIGHQIISQSNFDGSPATRGSTRALASSAASVVQRYAYDAHGETLSGTGLTTASSAHTTWLFGGDGQYDRANGLTNHIARWRQGHRFLSLDPYAGNTSDPISLHKYLYGNGNPVLYTDPSGLFGLAGFTAGFSIANSLRNLDIGKNLFAFDLVTSLVTGIQAGHSAHYIFAELMLNQSIGFGLGFAIGSANKWSQYFDAPNGGTIGSLPDLLEANAARRLAEIQADAGAGSHFFSRHGAQTTIEQQYLRATRGITPDGFNGSILDSSRFMSHRSQLNAVQAAQEIYQRTGKRVFTFDAGYEIGEGFSKNGIDLVRTSNVRAVFDANGKIKTLFPYLRQL